MDKNKTTVINELVEKINAHKVVIPDNKSMMQEIELYMLEEPKDIVRNMISVRMETRLMQDTIQFNKEMSDQFFNRMLCDGLKKLLDDDNSGSGNEVEKDNIQDHPDKGAKDMCKIPGKHIQIEGEREGKNIKHDQGFES